jgi:thioredoxin 1
MNKQLLTETLQKENTVVLFYADWCGGCKVALPMVEEIANKLKFKLVKINENTDLEDEFAVDFYPHIILSHNGKTKSYAGLHPIKELYESII